jgi:hypothetical protein
MRATLPCAANGLFSAGSTSPLWSALLAIGFLINLEPYIWTYFLGLLTMWALGVISEVTARRLISTYQPRLPWVGFFIIVEWHLLWAAMSGMETLLHGLIATTILAALMMNSRRYLPLGLLTGVSVWVRPDGLTLLGPLVLAVILFEKDTPARLRGLLQVFIGFGAIFFFYLLFNLLIGDTPMPNTFYAKQAEYAEWQLIAAHDIGALGYFDYHNLIDLAGLISPDVIPFIRDEPQLANYLDQNGADYLIAFPEFYPLMTGNAETVFVTNSAITLAFDQKNMVVYLWKTP